jgi:anti-sigma regulatory factor (Ser/Thr protein kinase)
MPQQIEVPARWEAIAALMAFCDQVEQDLPLSPEQGYLLRLTVEEIATNLIKYGYPDPPPPDAVIQVQCAYAAGAVRITVRDRGRPYDPLAHPLPDLANSDPATRDVGGLGLFFVREMADTLAYSHDPVSGWNELVVTKGQL